MARGSRRGFAARPLSELRQAMPDELAQDGRPLAVACSAGNRRALAASLLERAGRDGVIYVTDGGIDDLENVGIMRFGEFRPALVRHGGELHENGGALDDFRAGFAEEGEELLVPRLHP